MTQEWTFLIRIIYFLNYLLISLNRFKYNVVESHSWDCLTVMVIHSGIRVIKIMKSKKFGFRMIQYLKWLRIDSAIIGYDQMKAIIS